MFKHLAANVWLKRTDAQTKSGHSSSLKPASHHKLVVMCLWCYGMQLAVLLSDRLHVWWVTKASHPTATASILGHHLKWSTVTEPSDRHEICRVICTYHDMMSPNHAKLLLSPSFTNNAHIIYYSHNDMYSTTGITSLFSLYPLPLSSPRRLSCWRRGQTRLRAFPSSSATSMPARSEIRLLSLWVVGLVF